MKPSEKLLDRIRRHRLKRAGVNLPQEEVFDQHGEPYVPVGIQGVLAASSKLLAVNRGLVPPDDRDSWEFKRVMTTDRLMRERIRMDASKMRRKISMLAAKRKTLKGIPPNAFDKDIEGLLVGNPLSSPLEEINPMQLVGQARRITMMGPGGIGSDDAVTPEMQAIHPSQFGFISTLEGPESARAGVDVRLATGTRIGSDGRIYQQFKDRSTGAKVWRSPEDLSGKVVSIPA